jgi:hypothetical protein
VQADKEFMQELDFDAENFTLKHKNILLRVFTKVKVQISIDESTIEGLRQRLKLKLLEPSIPGLCK